MTTTLPAPTRPTTVLGIALAVVAAFILSSTWYALLADAAGYTNAAPPWIAAVELVRSTLVASGLAVALTRFRVTTAAQAVRLGLGVFVTVPLVLLSGSVLYDGTPLGHALLHGGDWIIKLVTIPLVLLAVRKRATRRA